MIYNETFTYRYDSLLSNGPEERVDIFLSPKDNESEYSLVASFVSESDSHTREELKKVRTERLSPGIRKSLTDDVITFRSSAGRINKIQMFYRPSYKRHGITDKDWDDYWTEMGGDPSTYDYWKNRKEVPSTPICPVARKGE